jgi:HK97 family phage portal protein
MGFFDDLTKGIKGALLNDINELSKGDGNSVIDKPQQLPQNDGSIGQKAIIDDPFFDQVQQHFIFRNKVSRISNKTLKSVSMRDWVVSAAIQARCDTMLRFARPQHKMFEMGFKIRKKNHAEDLSAEDRKMIENLQDFIYHCGRKDKVPPGDEMNFGEFLKLCTRDALTFGHVAIEKVLTRKGSLHRFRPVPSEAVYNINSKTSKEIIAKEIINARKTYKIKQNSANTNNSAESVQQYNEPPIDYYKYVQMSYDERVLAAFGNEDMIFKLFNPQNFADSMGYCYSPLELAIINVTNHLNVENYNSNFFTHGYAARGILHLKGGVTQSQLASFRRQFYNSISGTQNAWRTPIIAGIDDVNWVPMSGSAKEMEYLNYNNHVIRAICTQFQIDPVELGLDYLISGTGRSSSQQANNEYKINYSRERGLIPILMLFEDMINTNVLPAIDPEIAKNFEFKFTGIDEESAQTNVALQQAQMTVFSTMNDLLRGEGKEPIKHEVANLPLNQTFWALVEKNMTRGEIRATFFGDKDADKRRELQYLPADPAFLSWQQLLLTIDSQKKQAEQAQQQAEQEAQQAAHDQKMAEAKHSREQEIHDLQIDDHKNRQAHAAAGGLSLKDTAKQFGAGSKAINIDGQPTSNPINSDLADK